MFSLIGLKNEWNSTCAFKHQKKNHTPNNIQTEKSDTWLSHDNNNKIVFLSVFK